MARSISTEHEEEERTKEWTEFPDLATLEFDSLVREYRQWHESEKAAKEAKERIGSEIQASMLVVGQKKLRMGDLIAVLATGSTARTLSAQRLLDNGVDADLIARSWAPGTKYSYVQVRKVGAEHAHRD